MANEYYDIGHVPSMSDDVCDASAYGLCYEFSLCAVRGGGANRTR